MKSYQSLSGAQNFLVEIQENQWSGEVHSTFERTINLVDGSGTLYTIAAAELDDAPNTIRVAGFFKEHIHLPLKTPAFVQNNQLMFEGVASIAVNEARKWQYPQIKFPAKEAYEQVLVRSQQVQNWLEEREIKGGYLLNDRQATTYEKMMHTMLWKESTILLEYLKNKQPFQAMTQLNRVIGLGPGLTPSGDDFLVGLALIFTTVEYPYHSLQQWLVNCRKTIKRRTNAISFSTLDWAIKGAARERIGEFLNELFYGEHDALLKQKMLAVLAIGSSSGGDILAGILAGIALTMTLLEI